MDKLNTDMLRQICQKIGDRDKINLLSVNNSLHLLKNNIYYNDRVHDIDIQDLWYYDQFTNIYSESYMFKLPKNITHLTFGNFFDYSIKNCIPSTITHLTFGRWFTQDIQYLPKSVIFLTLSEYYHEEKRLESWQLYARDDTKYYSVLTYTRKN